MAKITTITNPLTGQPAQVDQLDHTAQQIDDGLNIARGVSNPNLLDNWYFGNPVNQRGQTEYTGVGYTIDRWKSTNSRLTTTIKNDCANLVADTSGAAYLRHPFERPLNGVFTLSALIRGTGSGFINLGSIDNVYSYSNIPHFQATANWNLTQLTFNTADATFDVQTAFFRINAGSSVDVLAVKLELGTHQTLAHQDANGNWQLNELPNYADTLARCQRYQWQTQLAVNNWHMFPVGKAFSTTELFVVVSLPTTMRDATPTISFDLGSAFYCWDYTQSTKCAITDITIGQFLKDRVLLVMKTEGLTVGNAYFVQVKNGFVRIDNNL